MKGINVVQFVSYFPPHKGGLEFHSQERAKNRVKNEYGQVLNVVSSIGQNQEYGIKKEYGYTTVIIPSFEIIPTFAVPKLRTIEYKRAIKKIKEFNAEIYQTRTRFFPLTLLGGILAKMHKKKRVHIEHGVDYVKLNTKWKNVIARTYDQTIGRWVFRSAQTVIGISQGCKHFSEKFTNKNIPVIYRGIEFNPNKTKKNNDKISLGFVGRLVKLKGVDDIIQAISIVKHKTNLKIELKIVGDGEEREKLEKLVKKLNLTDIISFLGSMSHKKIEKEFLSKIDIYINASYQEGLPPTVIEALLSECVTIATDVGGTAEISNKKDLILVQPGQPTQIANAIISAIKNKENLSGLSKNIVKEKFDRKKNIKEYYNLYHNI